MPTHFELTDAVVSMMRSIADLPGFARVYDFRKVVPVVFRPS
jgi:hypothetical protein